MCSRVSDGAHVVHPAVMRVARAAARDAIAKGAQAVVLTGSHVQGDASPHSDIDLVVIVARPPRDGAWQPYTRRGGYLVATACTTARSVRASFRDPSLFTTYVPGWRDAVILHDTDGVGARLQSAARRWSWDRVADVCDEWVAERITGWSEEVHKLVAAMERGDTQNAAAQRSLLGVHLASVMAVRRRILFGTDNRLWDLVAAEMGEPWVAAQSAALSEHGETLDASCSAALRLYVIAAEEAAPLLDRAQRVVVGHACTTASEIVGG